MKDPALIAPSCVETYRTELARKELQLKDYGSKLDQLQDAAAFVLHHHRIANAMNGKTCHILLSDTLVDGLEQLEDAFVNSKQG